MFSIGFFPCNPQCIDITLIGMFHFLTNMIAALFIPYATMLSAYPISKVWGKNGAILHFSLVFYQWRLDQSCL
ncbi:MAG: hypothetical protein ACFE8M_08130 [Candidatus Hermodarchaeota archaeon]